MANETKKYVGLSTLSIFLDKLKSVLVPTTRTINNKALSDNITLSASDVGADEIGSASMALFNANTYTDDAVAQKTQVQIITWGADD